MLVGFEKICLEEKPDLVVVVGDVNSTMACAIVAAKLLVPSTHIEAGLRSFDRTMPEEVNDEVERILRSWTGEDLVVSVRGLDRAPEPTLLVREGELFLVSGEGDSNAGPEEFTSFAGWFQALEGAPAPLDLELVRLEEHLWGSANTRGRRVEGFPHVLRIDGLDC